MYTRLKSSIALGRNFVVTPFQIMSRKIWFGREKQSWSPSETGLPSTAPQRRDRPSLLSLLLYGFGFISDGTVEALYLPWRLGQWIWVLLTVSALEIDQWLYLVLQHHRGDSIRLFVTGTLIKHQLPPSSKESDSKQYWRYLYIVRMWITEFANCFR